MRTAFNVSGAMTADSTTFVIDDPNNRVGINTATPSTSLHVVGDTTLAGTLSLSGAATISGLTTLNAAGGGAKLALSGVTSNWISWGATGVAAPAFTTSSAGTKLILYPGIGASSADYALGIDSSTMWSSVATTSSSFKWYGGTTLAMTLTGAGQLSPVGNIVMGATAVVQSRYFTNVANTGPYIDNAGSNIVILNRTTVSNVPLIVRGMASQSGALQQWQTSASAVVASVSVAGALAATSAELSAETHTATSVPTLGRFGATTTGGVLDWNDVTNTRPGGGPTLLLGTATNGPGGSVYFHPFNLEWSTKNGTGNVTQMAIPYGNNVDGLWIRGRYSGVWTAWKKIWMEGNDGAGSGLDADLLDGVQGSAYAPVASPTFTGVVTAPDLTLTGGDITASTVTTWNVLNTVATTINFGGAATTLAIGGASAAVAFSSAAITGVASLTTTGALGALRTNFLTSDANTGPYIALDDDASAVIVNRTTASFVPLRVRGMAAQSGDLQRWEDSTPTTVASVSSAGLITSAGLTTTGFTGVQTTFARASAGTGPALKFSGSATYVENATSAANVVFAVQGMASQSGDLQRWTDSTPTTLAKIDSAGNITATNLTAWTTWSPTITGISTYGTGSPQQTYRYFKVGKTVFCTVVIVFGTGPTFSGAAITITTPTTMRASSQIPSGNVRVSTFGGTPYLGMVIPSSTTVMDFYVGNASATYVSAAAVTNLVPVTLGNVSSIMARFWYEEA